MACYPATGHVWRGDDWVWSWTTSDDVSLWADPVVTFTASTGTVLASSETDTVHLDGGFGGTVPATNLAIGVFSWWVPAAVTAEWPQITHLHVRVKVNGQDCTILKETVSAPEAVTR